MTQTTVAVRTAGPGTDEFGDQMVAKMYKLGFERDGHESYISTDSDFSEISYVLERILELYSLSITDVLILEIDINSTNSHRKL